MSGPRREPARGPGPLWPLALSLPLVLCFLAVPLGNPDVFWHLSAGRFMLSSMTIPRADFLSFTKAGAPWIDFEWLAQVLYIAAFDAGGLAAVWLLKIAVLGSALAVVAGILGRQGQGRSGRAAGLLVLSAALLPSADVRPENFSLLFFSIQLAWLERERREGPWLGSYRLPLAVAFYALWANIHAGFVFGLALCGFYAVGAGDLTKFKRAAQLWLAGLAGTLINPYGPGLHAMLLRHAAEAPGLSRFIVEWRPVSLDNAWTWPFWLLLGSSMAAAAWTQWREKRPAPREHLLVLAALAAACWQTRNTPYFCIAAAVYLLRMIGRLRSIWVLPVWAATMAFLWFWARPPAPSRAWSPEGYPDRAASFLSREKAELGSQPLYHPYGWGGYLGWVLPSPYRIFWDGRYLFGPMLEEEEAAKAGPDAWQAYLDRHGIEVALLKHDKISFAASAESGLPRPFYVYFMPQQRWALVHWDPDSLVFVRRSAAPLAWIDDREYRYLRPGDEPWVKKQIEAGRMTREDLRHDAARVLEESVP